MKNSGEKCMNKILLSTRYRKCNKGTNRSFGDEEYNSWAENFTTVFR